MIRVATLLTDFGLDDVFVGVCHSVLAARAPHVRIIDLTHSVEPGDVGHGATLLARAVPHVEVAVHVAVVDPGVGSERRGLVVAAGRGDLLVGPDNGLLLPAADALGGVRGAWTIDREPVSATFHGRDVFAPVAGELAAGAAPDSVGPVAHDLLRLPAPRAEAGGSWLAAEVVLIDRFGNVQLAARAETLSSAGLEAGDPVVVEVGGVRHSAEVVRTFADLASGSLGVYNDSDAHVALAERGASAAQRLKVRRGDLIRVRTAVG